MSHLKHEAAALPGQLFCSAYELAEVASEKLGTECSIELVTKATKKLGGRVEASPVGGGLFAYTLKSK